MNNLLELVLKNQLPHLSGIIPTKTNMVYYYGFLITVIVNSVIWIVISTLVNQYYWKYNNLKKEFQLILKYIDHMRNRKSRNNFVIRLNDYKKEEEKVDNVNNYSTVNSKGKGNGNNKTSYLGSPLII